MPAQALLSQKVADVQNQTNCQPARSQVIDFMRAVAIMLVVFGHAQRGLFQTGQVSGVYWDVIYPVVDYFIYVFHIPVFFTTSGLLLDRNPEQNLRQFAGRMGRLVQLYLLWNTINAIPAVLFVRFINRSFGQAGYLDAINPVRINGIMWFFVALMLAHTFHFLAGRRQLIRWLVIGLSVAVLAIDADFHGAAYGSLWLFVGAEISRLKLLDACYSSRRQAGVCLSLYLITTALCYALNVPYYLAVPACAFALFALYSFGQNQPIQPSFLALVGKNTLSIYVMHVLAVAGMRIALVNGLRVQPSAALLVILTFAGIAAPLVAVTLLRRLRLSKWVLLD